MRALIAGAGYLGRALAVRLVAAGHEVILLRRSEVPPLAGARALRADLAVPGALAALPPVDLAFYTAAADERSDAAYERAYVTGLARLLERLARQEPPPRRLLFTSSTAVYAQRHGEWVDEASPTEPIGFAGRRLLEGEALVRAAPFPATVLRLGGIYGPGRASLIDRVERALRSAPSERSERKGGEAESHHASGEPRYTNRIHRDDAAAALAHLAALPDAAPCHVVVDCEPAPEAEVLTWLARRLGGVLPPEDERRPGEQARQTSSFVPGPPACSEPTRGFASREASEAGKLGAARASDRLASAQRAAGERSRERTNKRCSNARLLATGFQFRYPTYREGYAALLAERDA